MMNLYYFILNFMLFLIMILPSHLFKFHPLIFSLLLLFYSILMCLKLNLFNSNYWYSYILYLIMVGGILILLMYMTSISNNELFMINLKYYIYMLLKMILLMFMFVIFFKFMNNWNLNLINLDLYNIMNLYINDKSMFKNLYMNNFMYLNFYMIIYLFFTMLICVMICFKSNIPLRQLN